VPAAAASHNARNWTKKHAMCFVVKSLVHDSENVTLFQVSQKHRAALAHLMLPALPILKCSLRSKSLREKDSERIFGAEGEVGGYRWAGTVGSSLHK
jgi:hypothetical protein